MPPAREDRTGRVHARRSARAVAATLTPLLLVALVVGGSGRVAASTAATTRPWPRVVPDTAVPAWSRLCGAAPTASITQALAHRLPHSLGQVSIRAISPNGQLLYAAVGGTDAFPAPGFHGLEVIDDGTWSGRARLALPGPPDEEGTAHTAGPWFVWLEYYSDSDLNVFTVRAWNTVTDEVRTLGRSVPGWQSPLQSPGYDGTYAAWVAGDGPGPVDKVVLADLATGRARVVYQGHGHAHALAPFFDGALLVWPQATAVQGPTTLAGINVRTGTQVVLPPALRGVHAEGPIVTSGPRTAYTLGPDDDQLFYSASPSQPATVVLSTSVGGVDDLELGSDWLAWTGNATYLANTQAGSYVQVTPAFGLASGDGSTTAAIGDYAGKATAPPAPSLLDVATLTWPRC